MEEIVHHVYSADLLNGSFWAPKREDLGNLAVEPRRIMKFQIVSNDTKKVLPGTRVVISLYWRSLIDLLCRAYQYQR